VLLDEPTTGLDPQARRLLWETLRVLHERGTTFILTTHYMEEADRLCGRLAIVDHGRILTLDTPRRSRSPCPADRCWTSGRAPRSPRPAAARVPGVLNLEPVDESGEGDGLERLRLFVDPADGLLDRVLHAVRDGGADLHHVSPVPAEPGGRLHSPHRAGAPRMTAFLALLRRDLVVASRNAALLILSTLTQPILVILVFGNILPRLASSPPTSGR